MVQLTIQTWREPVNLRHSIRQLQIGRSTEYLCGSASDSLARGLTKAPQSWGEGEGIRRAASEDCCNFMAPLAASEPRAKRGCGGLSWTCRMAGERVEGREAERAPPFPVAPTWKRSETLALESLPSAT